MEYKNDIFYLQNLEEEKVSSLGVDATILYGVLVSMMNTHVELALEDMRDAFFALGGARFEDALALLEENGFINPDTNEIFIRHTQNLDCEYHIGSFTFHFHFNSLESKKAFEGICKAPETRKLVARAVAGATALEPAPAPVIVPLTITKDGYYPPQNGIDGYAPITVKIAPPPPWCLTNDEVAYVFEKTKLKRTFHKLVKGAEPPVDLSENAKICWRYFSSSNATHAMRLYLPLVNREIGLPKEDIEDACAELHARGYFFNKTLDNGIVYSLFIDHIINEEEWRIYENEVAEVMRQDGIRKHMKQPNLLKYEDYFGD